MTIKAVLFDLDETLLVRKGAIAAFIADQFGRHEAELGPVGREQFISRFLVLEDEGRVPKTEVYPALAGELGLSASVAAELLADYQGVYPRYVVLAEGAIELMTDLRRGGFRTGIITNGNAVVQNGKIDVTGLRPLLDIVLISEAEGLSKPDPRIFELALSRLGVAADQAIFVGDSPTVDVEGARNTGLTAIWYHSTTEWPIGLAPAEHTITVLSEVLGFAEGRS